MKFRIGLAACAVIAVANIASAQQPYNIAEKSISDLRNAIYAKQLTPTEITQLYLTRIDEIDHNGPKLKSVIEVNAQALDESRQIEVEKANGTSKGNGKLYGMPILVKDNLDATGMVNSAGSLALKDHRPTKDSTVVEKLRDAGAIIIGKTNLSEWANFRGNRSTSGWSSRGGQTKNPYALDRNPCGSSSGTGTAIAASLAAAGIGTETDGSIICPSAVAGLVGIKPTVGLVSRAGIIPISASQDTSGPMARTVEDASLILEVIAGPDERDKATLQIPESMTFDFAKRLKPDALNGKRIGFIKNSGDYHPDLAKAFAKAQEDMKRLGATLVPVTIPTKGQWDDAEFQVLLYEFKDGLEAYLRESNAPYKTMKELIEFNRKNADTVMPYFAQELFEKANAKGTLKEKEYLDAKAKARSLAREKGLYAVMDANKLDAVIAPSTSPAWLTDPINADHFTGAGYGMAAVAGTPSITVPMGDVHGLPIGITFMAKAWQEHKLIELAYAYEQATKHRKAPSYQPTISLQPQKTTLRVVTLNIFHDKNEWLTRRPQITDTLRELQPDAIALQEVIQTENTANQATVLAYDLGYHATFVSTDPQGQAKRYGNAILTRTTPIRTAETKLNPLTDSRTAVMTEIEKDGKRFAIFDTHLNYENNANGERIRSEQVGDLVQFIDKNRDNAITMIAGDFNTVSNAKELTKLTATFHSAYDKIHPDANQNERDHTTLNPKFFSEERDLRRIDHVFYDARKLAPNNAARLFLNPDNKGVYATDHFGVIADFTVN